MEIIKQAIKVKLTEEEKKRLIEKVDRFTDGELCDGMECNGIHCLNCPINLLDEQAKALRVSVLNFINGAE